jgi:hypothetical protein
MNEDVRARVSHGLIRRSGHLARALRTESIIYGCYPHFYIRNFQVKLDDQYSFEDRHAQTVFTVFLCQQDYVINSTKGSVTANQMKLPLSKRLCLGERHELAPAATSLLCNSQQHLYSTGR